MKRYILPLLLSMASIASVSAANFIWDGSTSGNWNTSANWTSNSVPTGAVGTPDTLNFPSLVATGNKTMTNNLSAGLSFNRLTFTSDGYTLAGNGITLRTLVGAPPTIQYAVASGEATVNVPITLANSATFSAAGGGRLNLGSLSDPVLAANTLTLTAGADGRIEMDGTTSGSGGITMNGEGTVVLDASQNATGTYSLTDGTALLLTSTIAGTIVTQDGTVLSAINANASSNVSVAGDMSVALSFDITGNLNFAGSGVNDDLTLGIGGTLPGLSYDQIDVGGTVTTAAHLLQLSASGGYPLGTEFILIKKTSAGAISNATKFLTSASATINEGTEVNSGSLRLRLSYVGGDGNDFTATVVPATASGTPRNWDGGTDADNKLNTANNWTGDALPGAGSIITFGDGTAEKTVLNNGGGNYQSIIFNGAGGYLLQNDAPGNVGQLLMLSGGGLSASNTTTACTLAVPLLVVANQNWGVSGAGTLNVDAAATVELAGFQVTLNPTSTGALNVNAPVSGTGNLNKDGSGLAVIGGTVANTYAGTTTVSRGELRLSKPGSATALTGSITLGGGASSATLSTTAAENIADTAVLTVQTNGTLQLGATETLAGLIYNGGAISNGANILALAGNFTANENLALASPLQFNGAAREITVASGKTLTLSGALSISPAVLGVTHLKKGPGTLIFTGTAPTVTLQADAGVLQVDTLDAVNRPLISLNGGTVQGNGRSRQVTAAAGGGTFTPGLSTGSSIWRTTGLALNSATTVVLDINGTAAGTGFDQLAVLESGTVSLGNAALQIRDNQVYPLGTSFRIIDNDGVDAVTGTFASLPTGASIGGTFNRYTVSYNLGGTNDVVLTVAAVDSGITRTWDGDGGTGNRNWSSATNWAGDTLPGPGDTLVFPLSAMSTAGGPINDFTAGIFYNRIQFTGLVNNTGNYAISGSGIGLVAGIENIAQESVTNSFREVRLGLPITMQPGATIGNLSTANPRSLIFTQALTTTGSSLRFVGRGGATPQGSIRFSGTPATVSGTARLFVESNAGVSLNGTLNNTWNGGTEIIHGALSNIPHERLPEGFVLTAGANSVSAGILAGTVSTGTAISVPVNATLTGGPLLCSSINVAGTATLAGFTASGAADVTGTLATAGGTLQAGTLNVAAGGTASGATLSVTTLNNTNGTVSITGAASIAGGLIVDGTDSFSAADIILSADFQLLSGSFSIPGRLTFQPGATRQLHIAASQSFGMAGLGGSSGNPVSITKTGAGNATVTTSLSFINALTISGGTLFSNAPDGAGVQTVSVAGGKLGGSGAFGDVTLAASAAGSSVSPGSSPGRMTMESLLATAGSNPPEIIMEINGPAIPGTFHDQISVSGDVNFPAASQTRLGVLLSIGYVPLTGTVYTLIDKTSPGPFGGQLFDGVNPITENYEQTINGVTFRFSYVGGDGNDLTATVTNSPAGDYRVWDGGGVDDLWTTAENWVNDSSPLPTESLRFPAGAARLANNNNFGADTRFGEIKIEDAYTLSGNRLRPARGLVADIPSGTATVALQQLFETGDTSLISLAGGGTLSVTGQINLGDLLTLTLRRTDPTFVLGGQPLDVAAIRRVGNTVSGVLVEGGGRVRFRIGTRDYTGTTLVRHGRLQLDGSTSGIPGDLTIGGGVGTAKFENPGTSAAGIPGNATLRLEPNGEHTFIGGGTLSDTVGTLDFAGGSSTGGALPIFTKWITRAPFTYTNTGAQTFNTSVGTHTRIIEIETGARHTVPAGSSIAATDFNALNLRKDGGGELRIEGTLTATTVRAAVGTLTAASGGSINATSVTVAGGTLAGGGTINADVLGNASGGFVAPGLAAPATPFGILTIHEKDYLPLPQTTLSIQIGGTTAGTQHDQLRQTRTFDSPAFDLNESLLSVSLVNGFQPTAGQTFRIIDKQTPGGIVRNFTGLPQGQTFVASGREWTISYVGGDGNDAVLTAGNSVLTALQQWRQTHFSTTENTGDAANGFDFDKDGLANLVEFAFGLDPKSAASAAVPQAVRQGNDLVITFTPPAGASGITYHGETSTTLNAPTWDPVTDTGTAPVKEFRIPITGSRGFLRIRVSEP